MQVLVNNLNINFQVYGQGLPIVVLHGWGDRSDSWYSLAQKFSNNYQVFLVDLPGFGASDSPADTWGVENYRDAIKGFIDELEINRPILVGHSHGGKIASHVALDPKYCRALVLVSSSGLDKRSLMVNLKILLFKSIRLLLGPFGKKGEELLEHFRKQLGSRDYQQAGALRNTMVKVVNDKLFSMLPQIKIPTLIIWGSDDKTLDVKQSKLFEKLIPDSYIRLVWGAAHYPQVDSPEDFADILSEFLPAK